MTFEFLQPFQSLTEYCSGSQPFTEEAFRFISPLTLAGYFTIKIVLAVRQSKIWLESYLIKYNMESGVFDFLDVYIKEFTLLAEEESCKT